MNWLVTLFTVVVAVLFLGSLFGPRESVDWTIYVSPSDLPEDLDAYLAKVEARERSITPGAEKRIVWAGAPGQKTALSVVYIHGFSATHREMAPAPERIAEALGANLYLTRLTGHGQPGDALGASIANDWLNDSVEAINIGERLGERVLLISASTGGTLSIALSAYPEYAQSLAGLVLVSPNLQIARPGTWLLTKPFARLFVPLFTGPEVSWEPANEEQGKWWTSQYPIEATFQLAALVAETGAIDGSDLRVPALFVYSEEDTVVKASATKAMIAKWNGPKEEWVVAPGIGIDPSNHVLAGDILSPAMTAPFVERVAAWARGL